jgi:hypothetical protein
VGKGTARVGLLGTLAVFMFTPAARAQMAVIDVSSIQQLVQQVRVMEQELQTAQNDLNQARQAYQSMTGSRGMQNLLSGTVRKLPAGELDAGAGGDEWHRGCLQRTGGKHPGLRDRQRSAIAVRRSSTVAD